MDELQLTALLENHATRHSVPGAALGVSHGGDAIFAYHGVTDVSTAAPVTDRTVFSLGSLTKTMVATVIVALEVEGMLDLDDPVAAHVPELDADGWAQERTLRDLLANRSGLPLSAATEFGFERQSRDDDEALRQLVSEIPLNPPLDFWSYSNVGWCVLGRAVETSTGVSWDAAMPRLLGTHMNNTSFTTGFRMSERVSGHEVTAGDATPVPSMSVRAYGPAGTTAVSTVTDLVEFARLLLADSSLAILREVSSDVSIHGWLDAWCLGLARFDWGDQQVWGWDGLISGERSVLRIMPEHDVAIVLMTNASTGRAMYRSLFSDLVPSISGGFFPSLRLDPSPDAAGDLARYAGVYAWPDRRVEVSVVADTLLFRSSDTSTEGVPIDRRAFLVDVDDSDNPTVTFGTFDSDGRPGVLYQMLWGLPRTDG